MSRKRNKDSIPKLSHDVTEKDFGNGLSEVKFKPRNNKQRKAYESCKKNPVSFLIGAVGTGKTRIAIEFALEELAKQNYNKIILLRSAQISPDEQLGFLSGDMQSKISPLVLPMTSMIQELVSKTCFTALMEDESVQPFSVAHVQGNNFPKSIVIVDEAQNLNMDDLRSILTRIHDDAKVIVLGDKNQIKLANPDKSCFNDIMRFKNKNGIGFIVFEKKDIVRGKVTQLIESCFEESRDMNLDFLNNVYDFNSFDSDDNEDYEVYIDDSIHSR